MTGSYDGAVRFSTQIDSDGLKRDARAISGTVKQLFGDLRDIMQGPVAAVGMLKDAIKGIGSVTVGQAGKIEDMVAAFTPLTGGAENAKAMVAALNKEAATTPFELEGIGKIAKQLLPVLGNDVEAVTKSFRMLGDTAGGNIEKLDSITRGYMKTLLKGKVDMESLNMIAEAGVPIYKELADSMGVTVAEMMDMSSKGKIGAADLTKAFERMTSAGGIFYQGMQVSSVTLTGLISTMGDAFKQVGQVIGEAFLQTVKDVVGWLTKAANGFVEWAREGNNLKDLLKIIASIGVTAALVGMTNGVISLTKAIATLNATALLGPTGIIVALGALVTALIAVGNAVHKSALKEIAEDFKPLIAGTGVATETIYKIQEALANASKGGGTFEEVTAQVKQMSEDLGISEDLVLRIGLASGKVTDEFKNTLREVRNYRDVLKESQGFVTGTPEWIERQKKSAESLAQAQSEVASTGKKASKEELKSISDRIEAYNEFLKTTEILGKKTEAGLITEREEREGIIKAAYKQVDALLELGYSFGDSTTIGGRELKKMLVLINRLETVTTSSDLPAESEGLGARIMKSLRKGIEGGVHLATNAAKEALRNIGSAMVKAAAFIKKGAQAAFGLVTGVVEIIKKLADFDPVEVIASLQELADGIADFFTNDLGALPVFFDQGAAIIENLIEGIYSNLPTLVETAGNVLEYITDAIIADGPELMRQATKVILSFVRVIFENLGELTRAGMEMIVALLEGIVQELPTLVPAILDGIMAAINSILENLEPILKAAIEIVDAFTKGIIDRLPVLIPAVVRAIIMIVETLAEHLDEILQAGIDITMAIIEGMNEATPEISRAIGKMIPIVIAALIKNLPKIIAAIIKMTPEIVAAMFESGVELVRGLIEGMMSVGANIWSWVKDIFGKLVRAVKEFFGIASPSKLFFSFGKDIIQGLINGILEIGANIWDAVKGVFDALWDKITGFFTSLIDKVQDLAESVMDIGGSIIDRVKGGGSNGWGIEDVLSGGLSSFFASGTTSAPGGLALVGEQGPELVNLPRGAQVFNASDTRKMLSETSGSISSIPQSLTATRPIMLQLSLKGDMTMDGMKVGGLVFQQIDKLVGAAYGSRG